MIFKIYYIRGKRFISEDIFIVLIFDDTNQALSLSYKKNAKNIQSFLLACCNYNSLQTICVINESIINNVSEIFEKWYIDTFLLKKLIVCKYIRY